MGRRSGERGCADSTVINAALISAETWGQAMLENGLSSRV